MNEVRALNHEQMTALWRDPQNGLRWNCLFMLPGWIQAWWEVFGEGADQRLLVTGENGAPLGIAPLMLQGETASFIGSADVCDYQDFIVVAGREKAFSSALFAHLRDRGITGLELRSVRPDAVAAEIASAADKAGCRVVRNQEDVAVGVELPPEWETYLCGLNGKQRHEIRRKIRRLHEVGSVSYRVLETVADVRHALPVFLHLFRGSRSEKAGFMTQRMERFFKRLVEALAREKMLRFYFLYLKGEPCAAALCFDFESTIYLYNSGYDPRFSGLSVGLLTKVFSLKDSIARGKRKFDFLKGSEPYKYRLGGSAVQLYHYRVEL